MTALALPPDADAMLAVSREPAWSPEAEAGILGGVLVWPDRFAGLATMLGTDDFFLPAHRRLWEAMGRARARGQLPDVVTIADDLRARSELGSLPRGEEYLLALANQASIPDYLPAHADLVSKNAAIRALRAACAEVASMCQADPEEAAQTLRRAQALILNVTLGSRGPTETLATTGTRVTEDLEAAEQGRLVSRVPTGIPKLDRVLGGGLRPEHLIVPIGLTSMGKSSLGFQIAFRGAAEREIPALIFSLEMSREEVFVKAAGTLDRIDTNTFNHPTPGNGVEWTAVTRASMKVARLSDLVRVETCRKLSEIVATATAWRASHPGRALILVDHLQKVHGPRPKGASREQEVTAVAGALKELAKDLKLPVMAPAQLDNDAAKENRAPKLGDTRDSKAIEHDSDVVIGIHRTRLEEEGNCELIVLKHRGGKIGKAIVRWQGAWQGFESDEDDGQDRRLVD